MSSVLSTYCGHSVSLECMSVMPTDAQKEPRPDKPFCLAPQGTASIFSSIARSGWFFFLPSAERGNTATSTSATTTGILKFIKSPSKICRVQGTAGDRQARQASRCDVGRRYCLLGLGVPVGEVAGAVVAGFFAG